MALTIDTFKRPAGRLDPDWFDDLDATLTALLTEATAAYENAAAQTAYVYTRAYEMLADDAAAKPATVAADDVRETYTPQQLLHWRAEANRWRRHLDNLTAAGGGYRAVTPTW